MEPNSKYGQQGKTIVFTTHYLEEADALAQRVIVVNHSQIVAEGTTSEIKAGVTGKTICFHSTNLNANVLYPNIVIPNFIFCDVQHTVGQRPNARHL